MKSATATLLKTDAYKLDHRRQYPEDTQYVFSNYTNRGSRIADIDSVVHFGLQAFLVDLTEEFDAFFEGDIDVIATEYTEKVNSILGPNEIGNEHIRELHALGYLPLIFRAVPEGTSVPLRVPSFSIENTEPDFYWLVNYFETWISAAVWQPSTSATLAKHFRQLLDKWAIKTTGSTDGVEFQGHDFSFRGMAGVHAAAASGAGHLTSFQGSDSLPTIDFVDNYYGETPWNGYKGWVLGSVPATEHSVMCAGGQADERETFNRLLQLYPTGIVSVVSDTWDLWNVLTNLLPDLYPEITARDGKLVIRPDSGDPVDIITGTVTKNDPEYGRGGRTPAQKGVIELLWEVFGGTVNEQGYKVLDPHIGAIYGDSITYDRAEQILSRLADKGFASTNIVFGVGSFTYQYQTRDTFSSAIKATWATIAGEEKFMFKNPVTDNGTKKSARGRFLVYETENGELRMLDELDEEQQMEADRRFGDAFETVWMDGAFLYWNTFDAVRNRVAGK